MPDTSAGAASWEYVRDVARRSHVGGGGGVSETAALSAGAVVVAVAGDVRRARAKRVMAREPTVVGVSRRILLGGMIRAAGGGFIM